MILDSLKNAEAYYSLHPLFKEAFEYIKSVDFSKVEAGKTELRGKILFVGVTDSDMKTEEDAKMEVHNKYIDIQLPISKPETYGWKARAELKEERDAFNEEKDIQFFYDKGTTLVTAVPGDFAIFFPQDGHAPCIGEGKVRKVVVKIKL
ncbi:biofilm protein TabA [Dysgonomonas sp. PFB1-18]|uniref:YhcH/YjgK/YiaL family protein n=1 Tax=unclassified Dysgonomonas TaxID=2630389 RepID=UPI002474140E|nr:MULTISPECIES: YhcH/YjgK/YiaL family protein [unclassified Dysgonomonas]MDH6308200.1 biofilm protein TabA [Dysgonomonas sp. PF1-14]MDH6338361.1 biofilm protein TabA [Dysgonomonas sp. PF1-16]MDH6379858.1 biofilm protein TabA [Dysgonomonas sp. PFB1-18]MDH6397052.1 biofilm protein TabA [Dysgonomonas sp. PF1-23]